MKSVFFLTFFLALCAQAQTLDQLFMDMYGDKEVYGTLRKNCASCHSEVAIYPAGPMHSHSDPQIAKMVFDKFINLNEPESSRVLKRIDNDHFCVEFNELCDWPVEEREELKKKIITYVKEVKSQTEMASNQTTNVHSSVPISSSTKQYFVSTGIGDIQVRVDIMDSSSVPSLRVSLVGTRGSIALRGLKLSMGSVPLPVGLDVLKQSFDFNSLDQQISIVLKENMSFSPIEGSPFQVEFVDAQEAAPRTCPDVAFFSDHIQHRLNILMGAEEVAKLTGAQDVSLVTTSAVCVQFDQRQAKTQTRILKSVDSAVRTKGQEAELQKLVKIWKFRKERKTSQEFSFAHAQEISEESSFLEKQQIYGGGAEYSQFDPFKTYSKCTVGEDKRVLCLSRRNLLMVDEIYTKDVAASDMKVTHDGAVWKIGNKVYLRQIPYNSVDKVKFEEIVVGKDDAVSEVLLSGSNTMYVITERRNLYYAPQSEEKLVNARLINVQGLHQVALPKGAQVSKYYPMQQNCYNENSFYGMILTVKGDVYGVTTKTNPNYAGFCPDSPLLETKPLLVGKKIKSLGISYDYVLAYAIGEAGLYMVKNNYKVSKTVLQDSIVWADFSTGHFLSKKGTVYVAEFTYGNDDEPRVKFHKLAMPEKIKTLVPRGQYSIYSYDTLKISVSDDYQMGLSEKNNLYMLYEKGTKKKINQKIPIARALDGNQFIGNDGTLYKMDVEYNYDTNKANITWVALDKDVQLLFRGPSYRSRYFYTSSGRLKEATSDYYMGRLTPQITVKPRKLIPVGDYSKYVIENEDGEYYMRNGDFESGYANFSMVDLLDQFNFMDTEKGLLVTDENTSTTRNSIKRLPLEYIVGYDSLNQRYKLKSVYSYAMDLYFLTEENELFLLSSNTKCGIAPISSNGNNSAVIGKYVLASNEEDFLYGPFCKVGLF